MTHKNVYYIFTASKNNNHIYAYKFNGNSFDKNTIDLGTQYFSNSKGITTSFYNYLDDRKGLTSSNQFAVINDEIEPSLISSGTRRKIYVKNDKIYLTFDLNRDVTDILIINMNDLTNVIKHIDNSFKSEVSDEGYSNSEDSGSFLIDENTLVQIKSTNKFFAIQFKDFNGKELKRYVIEKDKDIAFKNSEITMEKGRTSSKKILDKSNQFVRKVYHMEPSVLCYKKDDLYHLTIGGFGDNNNNQALYGVMLGGGLVGALIASAITANYSVNSINSYSGRDVIYLNCLFDKDFNHQNGVFKTSLLDQLRIYFETNESVINKPITFKIDKDLFLGSYDKKNHKYSFNKFSE